MENMVDHHCRGCIYLSVLHGVTTSRHCDYIGHTGHRRPCPAGKGCTVRKIGKKKPRLKLATRWGV